MSAQFWDVVVVGAGAAGLMAAIRAAERALGEPVLELAKDEAGFVLTTLHRRLTCLRLILTSGGQSYPGSGTTGDGYRFAARLGHTIIPPRPALVPLTTTAGWVHEL